VHRQIAVHRYGLVAPDRATFLPARGSVLIGVDATIVGRDGCSPYVLTPEDFRRKAKQAEAMAEATRDLIAREIFLDVATRWRRLADEAERNG